MQRPRLTERTVEALEEAKGVLRSVYMTVDVYDGPKVKRAITYLEDLLRWHRAKDQPPNHLVA
jgi:hypothetical protein